MGFQVKRPVLVVGIGGVGSRLAVKAGRSIGSDCLLVSNDARDLAGNPSVHISTESVINPSVQLIRGTAYGAEDDIRSKVSGYSTIVMMSNLAGKAGAAIAPVISDICKMSDIGLISFVIMPFKYEKDRIFNSGISLKRVREDSECTIVLDNDSLLESNPSLSPKMCYEIADSAIMHVVGSMGRMGISEETSILTTSKDDQSIEDSLRDSLKMLYGDAPPNSVKHSMLYVAGGNNIPVGVLNSITDITGGILGDTQVNMASDSEETKVVMLSSVQGMTKFESYDPLGAIPQENMLDWSTPDCSIDCNLDLYQME